MQKSPQHLSHWYWLHFFLARIENYLGYGQIARYVGVAMAADAVRVGSDLKATDVFAGYVAYQHFWTPALRSSLMYSIQDADYANDTVAAALNKEAQSSRINLFYSPDKALDFGVEYVSVTPTAPFNHSRLT